MRPFIKGSRNAGNRLPNSFGPPLSERLSHNSTISKFNDSTTMKTTRLAYNSQERPNRAFGAWRTSTHLQPLNRPPSLDEHIRGVPVVLLSSPNSSMPRVRLRYA